ncbi:hypothetical protein HZS_6886 [Henneguya salminicola]|nr:hypothetical protein HZS_6886 [Henneguya salminicola]
MMNFKIRPNSATETFLPFGISEVQLPLITSNTWLLLKVLCSNTFRMIIWKKVMLLRESTFYSMVRGIFLKELELIDT